MIRDCRVPNMTGAPAFDWVAVERRLKLHELWTARIERDLTLCERTMRMIEFTEIEEQRERERLRAKAKAGSKIRR